MSGTVKKLGVTSLLLGALTGCSSTGSPPAAPVEHHADARSLSDEQLKTALLNPSEIPHLFWQQRLTISFANQEHKISAVIQNDGEVFQVLAVGPANTRLFLISQLGKDVSLKVFVDRQVNLDPGLLLLDIQRALFWFSEAAPPRQEITAGMVRGFCATDSWHGGAIKERKIADIPQTCEAALAGGEDGLVIRYEPPYTPGEEPHRVTLSHARRDYTIVVEHLTSQEVPE